MNVEKIRQLEEIPLPPPLQFPQPQGLPTDSWIGPAAAIDSSYKPSKPKLKKLELALIDIHDGVSRNSKNAMKVNAKQIDRQNVEFEQITNRHIDALQKSAEAAQSSQTWSYLQQLSGVVLAVANIGLGAYAISQDKGSDTAGALLIAAGITALIGVGIDEWMHNGSEPSQGFLPVALPIIFAMASLALSMAASRYSTTMPEVKDLLGALQLGINGIMAAVKPYLEFIKIRAELGLIGVQKDLFLKDESIKNLYQAIETLMREFERITRVINELRALPLTNPYQHEVTMSSALFAPIEKALVRFQGMLARASMNQQDTVERLANKTGNVYDQIWLNTALNGALRVGAAIASAYFTYKNQPGNAKTAEAVGSFGEASFQTHRIGLEKDKELTQMQLSQQASSRSSMTNIEQYANTLEQRADSHKQSARQI